MVIASPLYAHERVSDSATGPAGGEQAANFRLLAIGLRPVQQLVHELDPVCPIHSVPLWQCRGHLAVHVHRVRVLDDHGPAVQTHLGHLGSLGFRSCALNQGDLAQDVRRRTEDDRRGEASPACRSESSTPKMAWTALSANAFLTVVSGSMSGKTSTAMMNGPLPFFTAMRSRMAMAPSHACSAGESISCWPAGVDSNQVVPFTM